MTDSKEKQRIATGIKKAEAVEFLTNKLKSGSTRIIIFCGTPTDVNGEEKLVLSAAQVGFTYDFEVDGFIAWCLDELNWCNGKEGDIEE